MEIKELIELINLSTGSLNKIDAVENGKYNFYVRSKKVLKCDNYNFDGECVLIPGEGVFLPQYSNGKIGIHQRVYYLYSKSEKILNKYLYYWLVKNISFIEKRAVGTTVKSLRISSFKNININLINLLEQQEIIDIIEQKQHLFLKYHKLVRIDNIENFRTDWNNLIDIIEPFEKKLKFIEDKIEQIMNLIKKIVNNFYKIEDTFINKSICFMKGINFSNEMLTTEKEIPFINISSLNGNINKYIKFEYKNLINVNYGDVLLSLDGTPGLVSIFLEGINGYAYKIESDFIENYLIYFSLLSNINQNIIKKNSKGTTILHASSSKNQIVLLNFMEFNNLLKTLYKLLLNYKKVKNKLDRILENLFEIYIV